MLELARLAGVPAMHEKQLFALFGTVMFGDTVLVRACTRLTSKMTTHRWRVCSKFRPDRSGRVIAPFDLSVSRGVLDQIRLKVSPPRRWLIVVRWRQPAS